jgi:hypothetical protein
MNKENVQKGIKKIFWGIGFCFIAPVIIMQAFKNEGHPMYWPVLIFGIILFVLAIGYGFLGISTLVSGLLGKKKKKQS